MMVQWNIDYFGLSVWLSIYRHSGTIVLCINWNKILWILFYEFLTGSDEIFLWLYQLYKLKRIIKTLVLYFLHFNEVLAFDIINFFSRRIITDSSTKALCLSLNLFDVSLRISFFKFNIVIEPTVFNFFFFEILFIEKEIVTKSISPLHSYDAKFIFY